MNKLMILLLLLVVGLGACVQDARHFFKSVKTSTVGAHRKVTLYNNDGGVIKAWQGRMKVKTDGSTARFINDGKVVHISGTFIVQEQ